MTVRAIAGLALFNVLVLIVGACVLFGLRGLRTWWEVLRLAGVGYLLGVASFFVLLTLELVVGIPLGVVSVALTGVALGVGGLLIGRRRGFEAPSGRSEDGGGVYPSLFGALLLAALLVYLEALFRPGRLSGSGWDVWASWVPKARAIYFSGGIDAQLFASLPGPSYPPGLPALHAAAFHAMGSADAVTLHLQQWFFVVGFAAAVAGLLAPRVRTWILLPLLLLLLLMPDLRNRATDLYADTPLGYLLAVSALLVLLWVVDGESWKLWAATLLLGGAMLTKREGILFAACIVLAGLVASVRDRRYAWPRLAAAGLVAFGLTLPWRIWFMANDIPSDAPESGYLGVLHHLDRFWPSLRLVVSTLFDYQLWLLVPTLAIVCAVLAFLAGARREAVFAATLLAASVLGSAWTYWSNPSLEISRADGLVNRVVGSPLLMVGVLLPLLLELAWQGRVDTRAAVAPPRSAWRSRHGVVAVAIVAVVAVAYPAITLAGGLPRFPGHSDCVVQPVAGEKVRVVFGYAGTYQEANTLLEHVLRLGFDGTEVEQDGCGRLRVSLNGVASLGVAEAVGGEARKAGLEPTFEHDPGD